MLLNDKPGEYTVISLVDLTPSPFFPITFLTGKGNKAILMASFRNMKKELMGVYYVARVSEEVL